MSSSDLRSCDRNEGAVRKRNTSTNCLPTAHARMPTGPRRTHPSGPPCLTWNSRKSSPRSIGPDQPKAGHARQPRDGGKTSQGTVLTTITTLDPIYCYVDADERAILKYQRLSREKSAQSAREVKVPAYLALSNEREFSHEGYIDFVDNRLQPGTGTLERGRCSATRMRLYARSVCALRIPGSRRTTDCSSRSRRSGRIGGRNTFWCWG